MIKIVGVRFRNAGKVYYFDPKDLSLRVGDHVIVETSKGPEYGVVTTGCKMVEDDQVAQPLRAVVRTATGGDEEQIAGIRVKERDALKVCREKVREHALDMKVVGAEYAFDGSKMLFYFTADGRVDFRELVKDLAGVFHMRIELRQIGVRDETRMLGGIGTCGRELCCATYLREFQPVSIKMAKEQNLSLNPAKISGTCGRLMCCLKNEEDTYEFLNAKMPKMGSEAVTADGRSGKVVELDVLRQRVRVLFEENDSKELEYYSVEELTFQPRKKKDPSAQGQEKGRKTDRRENAPRRADRNRPEHADGEESPENVGGQDASAADSPDAAEHRKRSRRRRHRPEQAPSGMESGSGESRDVGQEMASDRQEPAENEAGRTSKRRRRHRSRRPGAEHGTGAGSRPQQTQEGQSHTSEMRIYADSGSRSD